MKPAEEAPSPTPESPYPLSRLSIMGAAISLRFALEERIAAARASAALLAQSMRSRKSRGNSQWENPDRGSSKEWLPEESGGIEIVLEDSAVGANQQCHTPRPKNAPTLDIYGTPMQVLTCKFVIAQVVFNAVSSVICSVLLFYLLFVVVPVPPGDPLKHYPWWNPNCVGVIIGSVLIVSPTLVMILAPAGLPEAVDKGWFRVVRYEDCPPWLLRVFVFLGPHERWRRGLLRHVTLGLTLSTLFIPVPLLLARYVVADSAGYMPTWTLIWFDLTYETILTFPCTALGLLAFSMEPNYERTKAVMSTAGATQANPVKRLLNRVFVGCLRLLW